MRTKFDCEKDTSSVNFTVDTTMKKGDKAVYATMSGEGLDSSTSRLHVFAEVGGEIEIPEE